MPVLEDVQVVEDVVYEKDDAESIDENLDDNEEYQGNYKIYF